ncbi:MAG: hypothetical protein GSR84_02575 [Desulfurococcales archaeon]|nr:hypothetical protein [Desulfurococcales archaeon]
MIRVRSRPLAALMLLYKARQISELLEEMGEARILVGTMMGQGDFEAILRKLTGGEWRGVECNTECGPGDLAGIASFAARLL